MIPVYQRILDHKLGDCLKCCVASILELSYEDVPNFNELENWFSDKNNGFYYFLQNHGYQYLGHQPPLRAMELCDGVNGYYIATVNSVNFENVLHAVVFKGVNFVHDPSTGKTKHWLLEDAINFDLIARIQDNE